jgi:Transketolase, C-terminal subunit
MLILADKNEKDPIEMKAAYADTMMKLAEENPLIVDVEADMSVCLNMNQFKDKYPDRFFNVGIAEQSMSSIAAGLSAVGFVPFIHTFACFASRRMCDQNYLSCAYAKSNVKIVGSDPSICGAMNGGTHQANEDIAIMRSIPDITIIEPSDVTMLRWTLKKAAETQGVFYIRIQRSENISIYKDGSEFQIGQANLLREGNCATIIATGSLMIEESLLASRLLNEEGISVRVVDMFTIKPVDRDMIIRSAKETRAIVTVENHSIIGGLGSAVAEVIAEEGLGIPMKRIGVPDRIGEVGTTAELKAVMGMTAKDIYSAVKSLIC